ncbi:N-acyl homoserine lactonase family protein [Clostridium magnum]|uniref:N-acyl homoserine lactonase n=1 Tax=Clostridium magnum DSM 2767 TaxID=1121326 RepID=A0A161WTH1_9CLOT|nr:N-acyl homoserine lactonase family protein [Clostridium magnum]KZL90158.1 N-acyl homoserine lactonase [Clostridium magnum DSM 2767]SHH62660.1 Glyoxylase, beta-lactamase superfamily II [Clostridium magnum DSM 2767]
MKNEVKWVVKAIKVGSITLDRSAMTHYKGKGEIIKVPIWCAGATDGKHKVLVDTGIRDLEIYKKAEPGVEQKECEITEVAVKDIMGWDSDEVDIIINTHLHCDHSGSNAKFVNAKCYVQKSEWYEAFHPIAPEAPFYDKACYDKTAMSYFRWEFLEGDVEILPGLRVITTPGHTKGHQSVLFNTNNGIVCVSGDICNVAENVNENLEPNIVISVSDVYESLDRIREIAHYILPGHEPGIENGSSEFIPVINP